MQIDLDELLPELGVTPEEYQRKERQWQESLRKSIRQTRLRILQTLKQRLSVPSLPQARLRWYSQQYARVAPPGEAFKLFEKASLLQEGLLPIGSSKQDCYHLTHFINTCLLCLPGGSREWTDPPSSSAAAAAAAATAPATTLLCSVNPDTSSRLEHQQLVFNYLLGELQKVKQPQEPLQPCREERTALQLLKEILALLQEVHKRLC